jgi:CRP/FNR family cyclic AMP-dependent transcriptional regulator
MSSKTNLLMKCINQVSFFDKFSNTEKEKLVERSGIFKKYEKQGVRIFKDGDKGESVFVILEGVIKIARTSFMGSLEKEVVLATLKKGSVFGEIALLSDSKRTTTAITASSLVIVMEVDKKTLESFDLSVQKIFHKEMISLLIRRLDDMNNKFINKMD